MVTDARSHRIGEWVGLALLAGIALAIAALFTLAPDPYAAKYVTDGLFLTVRTYGLALPLLGLGFAMARSSALLAVAGLALLTAGLGASLSLADKFYSAHEEVLVLLVRLPIGNALMCVAAGLALALPGAIGSWLLPVAAVSIGYALGLQIAINSPGNDGSIWYSASAGSSGLLLAGMAMALRHALERPWFRIAAQILGSWLIATGLMLAGLSIAPRKSIDMPPAITAPIPDVDLDRQP
jgi:hypothetical protein